MPEVNYWTRALGARLNRRRVLIGASSLGVSAAVLAACGGSSSGRKEKTSSQITQPVDTSKQAKRGGSFPSSVPVDVTSFDTELAPPSATYHTSRVYNRLLRRKPGYLKPYSEEIEGDIASGWEMSADKLQVTFKLRPGYLWDQRPPTNGRAIDAGDLESSWKLFEKLGARRADIANAVNPSASVISVTAADPTTVVAKLAFPDPGILTWFAAITGSAATLPREADGGFDRRTEMRGAGPWYLAEYQPSSRFLYKRHPGYFDKEHPYIDELATYIVSEYASGLAQFRSGQIYNYAVRAEDIVSTKQDIPELSLYQDDVISPTGRMFYGFDGGKEKSPFVDERVRQAWSMALDRDLWLEAFYNVSKFQGQGLPVDTRWNTAVNCAWEGWWLDPKSKDFGPNAVYYQHNLAEAKKLLAAAGYANGLDVDSHHIVTNDYGADFPRQIEVMIGMAAEAGIRVKTVPANFQTDWRTVYSDARGKFPGIAFLNLSLITEAGTWVHTVYYSKSAAYKGFDVNGQTAGAGDPFLDDLSVKIRQEADTQKRWSLAHELQRYEAKKQYNTPFPGGASGFLLAWPVLSNYRVNRGAIDDLYLWLDDSKAPKKRA